jgi:superfamily II DNA/RNA helicase
MIGGAPRQMQHTGYDVIVTTLGLMLKHLGRAYSHQRLKHLVLDEADTLLDDSNNFDLLEIISKLKFKSKDDFYGVQMIMVSATIPKEMDRILGDYVDVNSFEVATTPMLHQLPRHITQTFIRIHRDDRSPALLRLAHQYAEKSEPTIIFSDTSMSSNYICSFLRENGIDCIRLNKSLGEYERMENFKRFQSGDCDFLSCTNLGSRGLDTTSVKNIINYDLPRYIADYIHRIGRVGRLGSRSGAQVTNFVSYKTGVGMLQELELAIRTGRPLDYMDANIKKLIRNRLNEKRSRFSAVSEP